MSALPAWEKFCAESKNKPSWSAKCSRTAIFYQNFFFFMIHRLMSTTRILTTITAG